MKLGLVIPNTGADAIESVRDMPARVEALGFDSLWVTDHVIGVQAYAPVYGPIWLEALSSLAYMAACTRRIRLGIGVLVVPYRQAVYTAKVLSTIDNLSQGRLLVGIGTGWSRSEFNVLGVGHLHEKRGKVTDEALAVMLRCWEGGKFGYAGTYTNFREMTFAPVPTQKPHPPLWIGGASQPALRRAAKFADAWHPSGISPADLKALGTKLDDLAGRPVPRTVRIRYDCGADISLLADLLAQYAEAGVIEAAVDFKTEAPSEILQAAESLMTQRGATAGSVSA